MKKFDSECRIIDDDDSGVLFKTLNGITDAYSESFGLNH